MIPLPVDHSPGQPAGAEVLDAVVVGIRRQMVQIIHHTAGGELAERAIQAEQALSVFDVAAMRDARSATNRWPDGPKSSAQGHMSTESSAEPTRKISEPASESPTT
jgi:hypothetical protein